jgi:hypothetical protein
MAARLLNFETNVKLFEPTTSFFRKKRKSKGDVREAQLSFQAALAKKMMLKRLIHANGTRIAGETGAVFVSLDLQRKVVSHGPTRCLAPPA